MLFKERQPGPQLKGARGAVPPKQKLRPPQTPKATIRENIGK